MVVGCVGGGALSYFTRFSRRGWCEWLIQCDFYCGEAIRANESWTQPQGKDKLNP